MEDFVAGKSLLLKRRAELPIMDPGQILAWMGWVGEIV